MFRFTEQELRDFLVEQEQLWLEEAQNSEEDTEEFQYARGAYHAYKFVLQFLDEYKLEEGK